MPILERISRSLWEILYLEVLSYQRIDDMTTSGMSESYLLKLLENRLAAIEIL